MSQRSIVTIHPPSATSVRAHRAKVLKRDLATVSQAARRHAGVSQRELAAELELQQPHVARCELAEEPHAPSVLHVASAADAPAARAWAAALVRWQGQHLALTVLERSVDRHGDNHAARLASVTVECTDLPRAMAVAIADGELSEAELEQLVRESAETAEAALEAHARFSAELQRRREARR